jgi:hypothetical protein
MNKNKSTSRKVTGTEPDNRVRGEKRLELILLGLDEGKSQRRIAAELGYDEGTVRRCIEIMQLPELSLTRILEGAPAEKYIRAERRRALQNAQQLQLAAEKEASLTSMLRRLSEEEQTGCHSDALARLILRSLRKQWGGGYAVQLISAVEWENLGVADRMVIPSSNPSKTLALCGWGKETGDGNEVVALSINVLRLALPLITPEWAIRCRALKKVRNALENPRQCLAKLRG